MGLKELDSTYAVSFFTTLTSIQKDFLDNDARVALDS